VATRASNKIVYAAIVSNVAIALCKYVAAAFTGSSSMLAEAFHSTVDSGNEILLLVGLKRSGRPPSSLHPFGHGKALYFYSLLVAVYTPLESVGDWPFIMASPFFATLNLSLIPLGTMLYWPSLPRLTSIPGGSRI
jgi:hypothetical protein